MSFIKRLERWGKLALAAAAAILLWRPGRRARANRLLDRGDIIGARAIYQRAAELGSGPAALALGATYDPNRLWSLGTLGLVGNRERARQWYLRAGELGHPEAKARLSALGF